jgi:peptide/nickel transport system substrate-binding protein
MRVVQLSVLCVLTVFAGACAADGDGSAGPTPTATTAVSTEGEPADGGTLVAAISGDPGGLNPAITTSGGTHTASELLYNGLVGLSPDGEPVPELASSWEIEEDGALYRFELRDDVTWHDGEPFTADDVVYTFNEVLLELHSRTAASVGAAVESIEATGDHTVEFRFSTPYAPLLQQLNVTEAPIVAEHIYAGTDPQTNEANNDPVGTGPFRFVSYDPDSEIRFERNPDYFEDGLPHLEQVVMRVVPDDGAAVVAFEAGELDWLWSVPGPDQPRLEQEPDVEFIRTGINPGGANCIMTVSFNLERPLLSDVRTRQAIAHALDRDQFLERVLFGQGRVAEAPIHSGITAAQASGLDLPGYDVARSEQLLDDAGWRQDGDGTRAADGVDGVDDGTPLAFEFLHFPNFAQYGELLRAQLAEVGAEVKLVPLEPPVFAERVFTDRAFDTNIISYCNGTDPEIGVRRMYTSDNIGPVPFSNAAAYSNETVDQLFDQAQTTIDAEERRQVYQQIQEIAVEELPYFWLVETESVRAHRSRCSDFGIAGHFAKTASCRE